MKMKKSLSFILCLLVFTCLFTKGTFAQENNTESDALSINQAIVGNIESGYTTDITVPTYKDGDIVKPYKVYDISFVGTGSVDFEIPTTLMGGTFTGKSCSSYACTVKYTANDTATVEQVESDLSSIKYKSSGTLTISVLKDENTIYYNGHYYKLTKNEVTWQTAMSEMLEGDTESYKGFKGHPVTITTTEENSKIKQIWRSSYTRRIWVGGITDTATIDNSYENGTLNQTPGGEGTTSTTAGKGTGYKWIWGTPEGDKADQTNNVLPDGEYWNRGEPNASSDAPGFAIFMGQASSSVWDDLTKDALTQGAFSTADYVTEYSPIDENGDWLYDENGNSATSGYNNPQIVSKTFSADNIHTHSFETTWTNNGTNHWHKCTNTECSKILDLGVHLGGTATCVKGKICETCNKEYGETNPNSHSHLIHVEAKDSTITSLGNIEYWYCDGCKKYYSDANATNEITKDSTIISTKSRNPKDINGDGIITCEEEMSSVNWVWSTTKNACVYKVSNTSSK